MNNVVFGTFVSLICSVQASVWLYAHSGNKYLVETSRQYNWYEALHACAAHNMGLLAIDTAEKHVEVSTLIRGAGMSKDNWVWTAGHDNAIDGQHKWLTTGNTLDFTQWHDKEPNNANGKEHCIELRFNSGVDWNDAQCTLNRGYICEEIRGLRDKENEIRLLKDKHEKAAKQHNQELALKEEALKEKDEQLEALRSVHKQQLNTTIAEKTQEMDILQETIDEDRLKIAELTKLLEKKTDELEAIKQFHVNVLDNYKKECDNQTKSCESNKNMVLDKLMQSCQLEMEELQIKTNESMAVMLSVYENKTDILKEEHQQELHEMQTRCEAATDHALELLQKSHATEMSSLREQQNQQHSAAVNALKEKHKEEKQLIEKAQTHELAIVKQNCEEQSNRLMADKNLELSTLQKINELQLNRTNSYKFYNFIFHGNNNKN